ncbi:MAG TPA: hypothetical protein VLK84_18705 [Longimicrobium sp.]|nr:hypothetical protein [Longimicrobium sp.]
MRKLKLSLDDLQVESFHATRGAEVRGTVPAHDWTEYADESCFGTCDGGCTGPVGSCGGGCGTAGSCYGTCINSCNGTCNCSAGCTAATACDCQTWETCPNVAYCM